MDRNWVDARGAGGGLVPSTGISKSDRRRFVPSPGILNYRDLHVFEGVCEHRVPKAFVEMLAQWRGLCTREMPVSPQHSSARGRVHRGGVSTINSRVEQHRSSNHPSGARTFIKCNPP